MILVAVLVMQPTAYCIKHMQYSNGIEHVPACLPQAQQCRQEETEIDCCSSKVPTEAVSSGIKGECVYDG